MANALASETPRQDQPAMLFECSADGSSARPQINPFFNTSSHMPVKRKPDLVQDSEPPQQDQRGFPHTGSAFGIRRQCAQSKHVLLARESNQREPKRRCRAERSNDWANFAIRLCKLNYIKDQKLRDRAYIVHRQRLADLHEKTKSQPNAVCENQNDAQVQHILLQLLEALPSLNLKVRLSAIEECEARFGFVDPEKRQALEAEILAMDMGNDLTLDREAAITARLSLSFGLDERSRPASHYQTSR